VSLDRLRLIPCLPSDILSRESYGDELVLVRCRLKCIRTEIATQGKGYPLRIARALRCRPECPSSVKIKGVNPYDETTNRKWNKSWETACNRIEGDA
jgi:hypothetical protein